VTRIGNFIPPYISRCVWASLLIAIALHRRRPLSFLYRIHWWDFFSTGVLRTRANLLHANNGLLDLISYKNGKWLAVRSSPSLEVVPSQDAWVFRRLTEMPIKQFPHPDKGSHPWFDSSIFRWCRPIGIPAVKPLSSFLTLLPIKSILRCPGAGETKEGLIDQLEQIHNLVPSVLNEGIKAGIVELVDSKVGDKQLYPYQAYHLFSRKSSHPVSESFEISVALLQSPSTHSSCLLLS
jgi:hypothetical protein